MTANGCRRVAAGASSWLQAAARLGAPRRLASSPGAAPGLLKGLLKEAQRNSTFVGGAGVALLAAGLYSWSSQPAEDPGREPLLSVMTWNILARPFTKYNREHHRAPQALEEESQTRERYLMAGEQIAASGCDLVLLQECEAAFFQERWNPAAAKLLQVYSVFPCRKEESPGTAVLVKKGGKARASSDKPICIGGSEETGGSSKIAALLWVSVGGKAVGVVSAHFTYQDGGIRERHAELIGARLRRGPAGSPQSRTLGSVVLGGDFNCQPGDKLEALQKESFLGELTRVELPEGTNTGLTGDMQRQVCIDHVYVSKDLPVRQAAALGWPKCPWGGKVTKPAKVAVASDHVPVWLELER